jgi:hypothetical protein
VEASGRESYVLYENGAPDMVERVRIGFRCTVSYLKLGL